MLELFPWRSANPGSLRVLWARLSDAAGRPVAGATVTVSGDVAGSLAYVPATERYEGVFELPLTAAGGSVRVNAGDASLTVDLAYQLGVEHSPTWAETAELLAHYAARFSPLVREFPVFHSEELHRDIRAAVVTDPAVPEEQKQVLTFTGRVHGTEETGTLVCFRLLDWLLSAPDGREMLRRYVFVLVPYVNIFGGRALPECGGWGQRGLAHENLNRAFRPTPAQDSPECAALQALWDQFWPDGAIDNHCASSIGQQELRPWTFVHGGNEPAFDYEPVDEIALAITRYAGAQGYPGLTDMEHFGRHFTDVARYLAGGGKVRVVDGVLDSSFWRVVGDGVADANRGLGTSGYWIHRYHAVAMTTESNNRFAGPYPSKLCHTYDVAQPAFHKLVQLCREGLKVRRGFAHAGLPNTRLWSDGTLFIHVDGPTPGARRAARKVLWAQRDAVKVEVHADGWMVDLSGVVCEPGLTVLAAWAAEQAPSAVSVDGLPAAASFHDGWVFVPLNAAGRVRVCVTP